jgi:hypothetical protein
VKRKILINGVERQFCHQGGHGKNFSVNFSAEIFHQWFKKKILQQIFFNKGLKKGKNYLTIGEHTNFYYVNFM